MALRARTIRTLCNADKPREFGLKHSGFTGEVIDVPRTSVAHVQRRVLDRPKTFRAAMLGILGGIGLLAGPVGLFVLSLKRDPALTDTAHRDMNTAFIAMLFLTSLTGFALMIFRATPAMGILLAVHLGVVLGLFLSLPYGKFVHGLYRFLALVKYASEMREGSSSIKRSG